MWSVSTTRPHSAKLDRLAELGGRDGIHERADAEPRGGLAGSDPATGGGERRPPRADRAREGEDEACRGSEQPPALRSGQGVEGRDDRGTELVGEELGQCTRSSGCERETGVGERASRHGACLQHFLTHILDAC